MQQFTGFEYLLIDAANQFGLDKLTFDERIQWGMDNLHQLEAITDQGETKERPLYRKAVMAIRKAQQGRPTGHLVGFDGVCSGVQIMSAVTGCRKGALATGLVDPNTRADAYTAVTDRMNEILKEEGIQVTVSRKDAKAATMTSFYGSKRTPQDIFGKETPELNAFYQAAYDTFPGAWSLLQDLLASWQPYALVHAWSLPDGYQARVKVMADVESRIEVDELDGASFTYRFQVNEGSKRGLANAANVVHSIDALVLREMHRRCNYDAKQVSEAAQILAFEQQCRLDSTGVEDIQVLESEAKLNELVGLWARTGFTSAVLLQHVNSYTVCGLPDDLIRDLLALTDAMLAHAPFALVTIHDEFKCHPNHMNHLRNHYRNILAELSESVIASDILSQIHGYPGSIQKLDPTLGATIRQANYALS